MTVRATTARDFAHRVLVRAGVGERDAAVMADSLIAAERAGHAGHGLARLPGYVGRLAAGGTVSAPWRAITARGPVEVYDGRAGLGHVHIRDASDRAVALAAEHGVGIVGVANSNHCGALGTHARRLAESGLVALMATNAPPALAPPGAVVAVLGSNAVAVAAPLRGRPPIVCDLSAAKVNRGAIMRAAQEGRPIPEGWACDPEGRPTTDANAALAGTIAPLGGSKGFALALAIELVTGGLLGPATGPQVADFFGPALEVPQGVSLLVVALDPSAFGDPDAFAARVATLARAVEEAGPPGATRLPGTRSAAHAERLGERVEVDAGLRATLDSLADDLGIPRLTEPEET
jgi:(2R)-3-sulfolactate dehydrogenase (NADP+)